MEISKAWQKLSEEIARNPGIVMLIGATDTGKTTLARYLIRVWTGAGLKVALVDSDMGQSSVGPPGTIGLKVFDGPISGHEIDPLDFTSLFFVGSFSPVGHLLQTVVGVRELVCQADAHKPDLILVDTTGLVFGGIGEHLKYRKVQLTRPCHVVLLQRKNELRHLQNVFEDGSRTIHVLPVSSKVQVRSLDVRAENRRQRLAEYLAGAESRNIPFPKRILWHAGHFSGLALDPLDLDFCSQILKAHILYGELGGQTLFLVKRDFALFEHLDILKTKFDVQHVLFVNPATFRNRLMALHGLAGQVLTIGVARDWDFQNRRLKVLSHPWQGDEIDMWTMGSEEMDLS